MAERKEASGPVYGGTAGPGAVHGRTAPKGEGIGARRQMVNFAFYKVDPAWRRLAEADFMLWRISWTLEHFQQMSSELSRTGLGRHLTQPYSYLSQTKRSIYV